MWMCRFVACGNVSDFDEALAAAVMARCLRAKDEGYAIVARTLALGEGQPQAAGCILEAHPWMTLRNVETLCEQGFLAHRWIRRPAPATFRAVHQREVPPDVLRKEGGSPSLSTTTVR